MTMGGSWGALAWPAGHGWRAAAAVAALLALAVAVAPPALAVEEAEAAKGPPLDIAVLVSSRRDVCFDPGDVAAIKTMAMAEQDRINLRGGIGGRPVAVKFLDDQRDANRSVTNVATALDNPQLLAVVGLSGSDRAKAAFEAHGKRIVESGVPFITDLSVTGLFKDLPNVFTTRSSQDQERIPVMVEAIRQLGYTRLAYIGLDGFTYSSTLGDALKQEIGTDGLVADHRLKLEKDELSYDALSAAVADLKAKQPDMVVLGIGSSRNGAVVSALASAGEKPALFVVGNIATMPEEIRNAYPQPIYQLAWDRLPELYNDRMRRRIERAPDVNWVFEGAKIVEAPGWKNGSCKERPQTNGAPDPFESANLRALALGAQFADMIGLVTEAANSSAQKRDLKRLRAHVVERLTRGYAPGRAAYKGSFENWSFDPGSRAAVRTPFLVILPGGLGRTQLAPFQLMRTKGGGLRRIDTLYLDIDLIKAHRVDDNEKSFSAEFYLSMRDAPNATIDRIEFTNAFIDPRTNGRQLTIELVRDSNSSDGYASAMKVYKVTGRFLFRPDLALYPFDRQRFSIDIQPKRGAVPFIIQPPPAELRDQAVESDDWQLRSAYVGYEEDFVPLVDAYTHEPSIVPFYKASFSWLMARETTDYFLRVVVPLGFILIVAYLSIFIPQTNFEAIVTIQVTALLSAVALYLSLPQLDSDTATLSDRLFVFNYFMVSLMIAISIARVNPLVARWPRIGAALRLAHIALVPLLVAFVAVYVYGASLGV